MRTRYVAPDAPMTSPLVRLRDVARDGLGDIDPADLTLRLHREENRRPALPSDETRGPTPRISGQTLTAAPRPPPANQGPEARCHRSRGRTEGHTGGCLPCPAS